MKQAVAVWGGGVPHGRLKQGVSCICPGHAHARSCTGSPTETSLKQSQRGGDPKQRKTEAAEGRRQSVVLASSKEEHMRPGKICS